MIKKDRFKFHKGKSHTQLFLLRVIDVNGLASTKYM